MSKQDLHPRTEVLNTKQKNRSKLARNETLQWLAAQFPNAFDNRASIAPLKVGIMTDLLAHAEAAASAGISKSKLREAVVVFTRRIDYLTCLKAREQRIDLEGQPCALVTEEEAEQAALKIKKRIEKCARNARNALEDAPPTPKKPPEASPITKNTSPYAFRPAFSDTAPPVRNTSVIVKHKQTRAYDPDAVARMKEKLGLRRE